MARYAHESYNASNLRFDGHSGATGAVVESQLYPTTVLGEDRKPVQSSANRDWEDPEVKGNEQVAESRARLRTSTPEKPKPNAEEELQALLGETGPPFPDHIMKAQPPKGFVLPKIDLYNGKTDPIEHLSHYRHVMALHSHSDAIMYRAFSNTLSDSALSWFEKLPPRSIVSFADLGVKFIN